jgi:hypothetical protein
MTSKEIAAIILAEVEANTSLDVFMKVFLKKNLIEPTKETYIDSLDESQTFEFWTVLVEAEDGHRIAYDEVDKSFVLGMLNLDNQLEYIGHQGTFIETFRAM